MALLAALSHGSTCQSPSARKNRGGGTGCGTMFRFIALRPEFYLQWDLVTSEAQKPKREDDTA